MTASSTTSRPTTDPLEGAIAIALCGGALPTELEDFGPAERSAAAAFVLAVARERSAGKPAIAIESHGGSGGAGAGARMMRLAIVNDDMPFLVDSVASAIAARGLVVRRVLHPIVAVRREGGRLTALPRDGAEGERRESIIYMEIDRAEARVRHALVAEIETILTDVRRATRDWARMQAAMRADAEALGDGEGAALLRWFLEGNMTLLGHVRESRAGMAADRLGILADDQPVPLWSDAARAAAIARIEAGAEPPLLVKSDRISDVHRRVPLDLVIVPDRSGGGLAGVSLYAGLWTSTALAMRSDRVPMLRRRLAAIEEKHGFDPRSHAGKTLRHTLSVLPHDILIALPAELLERVALTAMGLTDRPRPKLMLVPAALAGHMFAFVWLPRDEVSTGRRVAIGAMLERASGGRIVNWSMELGDGDLAFVRYTLDTEGAAAQPDEAALDRTLEEMVRGWAPALEAELTRLAGAARATRLGLGYGNAFPPAYRDRYGARAAAEDVLTLDALEGPAGRGVRLYRDAEDAPERLRLKLYRLGSLVPLSEAVPVLENFGFSVLEEIPTTLDTSARAFIHEFLLELPGGDASALMQRADVAATAIASVLEGRAENDAFNELIIAAGLDPRAVVLLRAWFRYLRQTGLSYGLATVAEALRKAPDAAHGIVNLFHALHDPSLGASHAVEQADAADAAIDAALAAVSAIDDDRILRRLRALVKATLRTNAFARAADEALAFKFDSALVPGLPAPVPWREIWIYSPRVEGIHLRSGPIARGGIRWTDRRDDFRTEILGLMKAQVVKNAVIVPTGAKGGFYPKALPSSAFDRKAWLAEGTESYRIFIRSLLSVTDNIIDGAVVHPHGVTIRDGEDPYFVVAADKGTAAFSDVANAIALDRGYWLGDAFASGGSHGYDHKAMGITARGAWISVTRHFAEMGVDVQADPVTVAGCGDMSGDVFGNGMLLSQSIRLVAAFDHRHIFLDPAPDAAAGWAERKRLFDLPTSSWGDYDAKLISPGGGIFARTQKEIPLSREVQALLGITGATIDPSGLITAILKAKVDLLWFGGIGTYIKGPDENNVEVGDPANDAHRINGDQVGAKVIGEGANLSTTQAGRIAFAEKGGRINTDFIDNSAGVDCSDNEVNIKIPLNREMQDGTLGFDARNALLGRMTDDVAALVLEDNRLQTLALSAAEAGGAGALPAQVRVIEMLEASGRLDRAVEGLDPNEALLRRAQEHRGLTRPELAILLAHGKMALQAAIEAVPALPDDALLAPVLLAAFPQAMQAEHRAAIESHRLRREIVATKLANTVVNRLGLVAPFELAEEEGVSLADIAGAYVTADAIFDLATLWQAIEGAALAEPARLTLFDLAARIVRLHLADLLRCAGAGASPSATAAAFRPGVDRLGAAADGLLRDEARGQSARLRERLGGIGAPAAIADRVARLFELDGAIGTAALARTLGIDEVAATNAYTRLGEALGLDWAKAAALRAQSTDPWERLLTAGLVRDFEQLRLDFLARLGGVEPVQAVDAWLAEHAPRVDQFTRLVNRARTNPTPTPAMLAQIAAQARMLLGR